MTEPVFIVCNPVTLSPRAIKASSVRECSRCYCSVWVSPSSVNIMANEHPEAEIVCIPCVSKMDETEIGEMEPLNAEQFAELREHRKERQ